MRGGRNTPGDTRMMSRHCLTGHGQVHDGRLPNVAEAGHLSGGECHCSVASRTPLGWNLISGINESLIN